MQATRALSIHIGLNHVDPSGYNGWDGQLSGCINDAQDMKAIADGLGYQSVLLTDAQATSSSVIQQIGSAAQQLTSGDILMLTYSGHGGQVPDVNGDEDDGSDETWVLYDRQLIDDELYSLWAQFQAEVRIVMLSDSCHSGTVLRMLSTYTEITREMSRSRSAPREVEMAVADALGTALGIKGSRDVLIGIAPKAALWPLDQSSATNGGPVARTMPDGVRSLVNQARAADQATQQWIAGDSKEADVQASVILISGCQDNQLSMDGAGNGLFTEKVKRVWNAGSFSGDYAEFARQVATLMPSSQQPNFATTGADSPGFSAQVPFTTSAPGASGPAPASTGHAVVQLGATGADVLYLQQRLRAWSYPVATDGVFGSITDGYVRDFQQSQQLAVDGVVGPDTWSALDGTPSSTPAATPGGGATPTTGSRPTLRRGDAGPDVEYLQERLGDWGYSITVDGNFGPMTESSVRSLQSSNGLAADGIVGPATWSVLG